MNQGKSYRRKPSKTNASRSKSSHRSVETDNTLNFPFLQDEETKKHIQCSKILIILRGLPGSGKSFLANKIKQKYGNTCVICSADHYFEFRGEYNFDSSKLGKAHQVCQQKAKQACHSGKNLIVVDNCNLREWEMEFYMKLAVDYGYIQLIIEPKSPWKFTVEILAAKNNHGLKENIIRKKLSQWEHLHNVYFAWFINEKNSLSLKNRAVSYLNECLRIYEFKRYFSNYMENPYKDFCCYFNLNYKQPYRLHCTAIYFGHKQKIEARRYAEELVVNEEYGKVSKLCIVGFIVTPQSFGACVNLTAHQLQIWRQDKFLTSAQSKPAEYDQLHNPSGKSNLGWENELTQALSSVDINSDIKQSIQCSSHITLGNRQGYKAKQTGIDLATALNLELQSKTNGKCVPTFKISGGCVKQYGSYWLISLEKVQTVNALFASFF